jgi:hypothetical protein
MSGYTFWHLAPTDDGGRLLWCRGQTRLVAGAATRLLPVVAVLACGVLAVTGAAPADFARPFALPRVMTGWTTTQLRQADYTADVAPTTNIVAIRFAEDSGMADARPVLATRAPVAPLGSAVLEAATWDARVTVESLRHAQEWSSWRDGTPFTSR